MSWTLKKLDQLGRVSRGRSRHRPRDADHLYGGPHPFVQTGDIKAAQLYLNTYSQSYSDAGLAQSKKWPPGTLCITIAANIAETAILGIEACFPDSVIGFVADESESDVRFVKYKLDVVKQTFKRVSQGAAQDNLSQEKLLSIPLSVPSVTEQRRIADILSAYDDLIENNHRRMELLEASARQLYEEWFVRLRFPGHEHTKITNGVPDGWNRLKLIELCDSVDYGYTASADIEEVGPKFLRITDIVPSFIDWTSVPYCPIEEERLSKFRLAEGDIVIARTGATVGYAKQMHKRLPESVFASYLVRLRPSAVINHLIMGVYVESDSYKEYVKSRIGGSAQPNANAQVLAAAEMLVPCLMVQGLFGEFVSSLVDQRELLADQNRKLKEARDILLPRLMSGEVPV